jgi:hypothetical protein
MGLPICEFFCLPSHTHTVCLVPWVFGSRVPPDAVRDSNSCWEGVNNFLPQGLPVLCESRIHQIFSVQMHTHALLKQSITVNDCDNTTGDKIDNNGDDATGYDDDDFHRCRSQQRQHSQ